MVKYRPTISASESCQTRAPDMTWHLRRGSPGPERRQKAVGARPKPGWLTWTWPLAGCKAKPSPFSLYISLLLLASYLLTPPIFPLLPSYPTLPPPPPAFFPPPNCSPLPPSSILMKRPRGAEAGLKKVPRRGMTAVSRGRKGRHHGSVRKKVTELRRLVPGGRELQAEQLLLRTAEYIFLLRLQVHALRALAKLYMP